MMVPPRSKRWRSRRRRSACVATSEVADLNAKVMLLQTARETLTATLARERREHVALCANFTALEEHVAAANRCLSVLLSDVLSGHLPRASDA